MSARQAGQRRGDGCDRPSGRRDWWRRSPTSWRESSCASCGSRTGNGVCVALSSRSFDSDLLQVLLSDPSRPAQVGAAGGAPPPNETLARSISVTITNTSSAATAPRGDQVVVDLDKQRRLDLVVAVLEEGDLHDQQLLRLRHAEVATGLTEVLGVVLVEQLIAVGIRRLERAHERRVNR